MKEFRLKIPFGDIVSSSYSSFRKRIEVEQEFWSEFQKLDWNVHTLGSFVSQTARNDLNQVKSLFSNYSPVLSRIEELDGRNFEAEFPDFSNWVSNEIELPPNSKSKFARSLKNSLDQGRVQEVSLALLGYQLSEHKNRNIQINRTELGAYYGAIVGAYSSLAVWESSEDDSANTIENVVVETSALFEEAGIAVDDLRNSKQTAEQDVKRFKEKYVRRFDEVDGRAVGRSRRLLRLIVSRERKRQKEFETLQIAFNSQLRLKRPVALWTERKEEHEKAALFHLRVFGAFSVALVICSVVVSVCFGDAIASAFLKFNCGESRTELCSGLSPKGPLIISSILLVSTVWLWFLRLQMRLYLSQRHLALDARERMAFAETYLALLKGNEVTADHEAVVLQSLFRPTQDGIVKDDVGPDMGMAGSLSRLLDRPK